MNTFLPVSIFVLCLFIVEMIYHSFSKVRDAEEKRFKKRLKMLRPGGEGAVTIDILRKDHLREAPWMRAIPGIKKLLTLIVQANANIHPGWVLLLSFLMAFTGYALCSLIAGNAVISVGSGLLSGYVPFLYLGIRKGKRVKKFEQQLPDALELIARTMRAGHAFSEGLKMVTQEFDDPVGTEFQRTLDEINFGISLPDALKMLAGRVACSDLRYFVVAVLIQRESGGNLAEIIDSIGRVIRERFKFHGRIKVLSAEGKFSAIVLCALPFLMAFVIYLLNPRLIMTLKEDIAGRFLVTAAFILMICGIFVLRNMVRIRV